jgi:midasin
MFEEQTFDWNCSSSRAYPPYLTAQTSIFLSMTRKFDTVPLYSIGSKLNQQISLQKELSVERYKLNDVFNHDSMILKALILEFLAAKNGSTIADLNALILEKSCNGLIKRIMAVEAGENSIVTLNNLRYIRNQLPKLDSRNHLLRGKLWIAYSNLFINHYIPDFPSDPAETKRAKISFLKRVYDEKTAEILVRTEAEYLNRGHYQLNDHLEQELHLIQQMEVKERKLNSKLPMRPEISQIREIFIELQDLKKNVLDPSIINQLESSLALKDRSQLIIQQELSLQDVLSSFIERLEKKYPYYKDLLQPLVTAIYQLKYGFRMLEKGADHPSASIDESIISKLLDFMGNISLQEEKMFFNQLDNRALKTSRDSIVYMNIRLVILETLIVYQKLHMEPSDQFLEFTETLLFSIADDWTFANEQKMKKQQQEESLYKRKETVILSDEEQELIDLKAMFPTFDDDFKDLDLENENEVEGSELKLSETYSFDEKKAHDITHLFFRLCESLNNCYDTFLDDWEMSYQRKFDAAVQFAFSEKYIPPSSLDEIARPGCLFISSSRINSIQSHIMVTTSAYDFYVDANIAEAKRVVPILLNYDNALNKALEHWPEHTVLLKLKAICRRIISFNATSPIMKLLLGLELLVLTSQDWQSYSSKEFSLKSELDEIVKLIVSWRKLELKTWNELLEIEMRKCTERVSTMWFALWNLINGISVLEENVFTFFKLGFRFRNKISIFEKTRCFLPKFYHRRI